MSYLSDYSDSVGWSVADTNRKTNTPNGRVFRDFLKQSGVNTLIRYYASTPRDKTISAAEAQTLSDDGFSILPVYQDNARQPSDFGGTNGEADATAALTFATAIGQPRGTTILFAVDFDISQTHIHQWLIPYFAAIRDTFDGRFKIGAYGGGAVMQTLRHGGLIQVPWLSMSRGFLGTHDFFYNEDWAIRQVPLDLTHGESGFSFDRNVLRWTLAELGAFRIGQGPVEDPIDPVVVDTDRTAARMFVATEGLKLRDAPMGNEKRDLTIGSEVKNRGLTADPRWRSVTVEGETGVAFDAYLRQPESDEIEALLAATIREWVRFDKGAGDEKHSPFREFVGEMWQAIGLNLDGASVDEDGEDIPWSAAFISFVVRRAGPKYSRFKFADAHSAFSHDAIQARILQDMSKPFWGYRITERRPELGDIVHRNRGSTNFSFEHAETHSQFKSHSDVVVEVRGDIIRVVGGNIGDTVSTATGDGANSSQEYRLTAQGFVQPGQKVIAILKNRANEV